MNLLVLGTGSANPTLQNHPSGYLLSVDNELFLIDCGEGTQFRLLENRIKHTRIRNIFISHLHGDHYFGLIGLLSSLNLNRRTEDLTIFAPRGLAELLTLQFKLSDTTLHFKIHVVETDTTAAKVIFENSFISVETIPLIHRVPCCGFLFRTKPTPRKILAEKLPENFPFPYIKALKEGLDVVDELTGVTYKNEDFTQAGMAAKSFAYCSDTAYNELIINQLQNVDTIFHEATFADADLPRAIITNHSTARQAALIARKANAQQLIIGHYSSRYKNLDAHLNEAKEEFEQTLLAVEGQTYQI